MLRKKNGGELSGSDGENKAGGEVPQGELLRIEKEKAIERSDLGQEKKGSGNHHAQRRSKKKKHRNFGEDWWGARTTGFSLLLVGGERPEKD